MFGLKNKIRAVLDVMPAASREGFGFQEGLEIDLSQKAEQNSLDNLMSDILGGDLSKEAKREIEAAMSGEEEALAELASMGVQIVRSSKISKPRYRPILEKFKNENSKIKINEGEFYQKIIEKMREPVSPRVVLTASNYQPVELRKHHFLKEELEQRAPSHSVKAPFARGIIAEEVISFYKNEPAIKTKTAKAELTGTEIQPRKNHEAPLRGKPLNFIPRLSAGSNTPQKGAGFINSSRKKKMGWWLSLLVVFGLIAYGVTLKNEIFRGGITAFDNLEEAGKHLRQFNFSSAAENFGKSYQYFSKTSQNLNLIGAGLAGIFGELPGFDKLTAGRLSKLKSAKDLTEAGKLIARSGQEMSQALSFLSQTGSILNPSDKNQNKPLKIINQIRDAVLLSSKNFQKAKALLANIDESVIPEDKKANFGDFKDKLPLLEEYLGQAIEYTDFLEGIVGIDKPKKYLLLFQNYSELRPAGGFPGTYGVVSFSGGGLADFFVDDVYNLDGQLKRNIIPPKQLQHITPTWGLRDSTWFIDFPTSAKKAMSFFTEEAGYELDGVIAFNPDVVSSILEVAGPVKMPEYDMNLTADNFLESIQKEVEYGPNRTQPKKVVVDFAPRFLEKIYSADADKWIQIFNILMTGLEEKDVLFYFDDRELENFVVKEGFGGEVKKTGGDYLTINFSNIKGSKTDAVTDSSVSIETSFEEDRAVYKVVIARNHNGGDHEHGFYNRQNPAYVRVLVPEEAELLNISGNDLLNFRPLVNYSLSSFAKASEDRSDKQGDFEKDRDLTVFEDSFYPDKFPGVEKFEESGKKGIGFWMVTEPGTTKKIEFEYKVPLYDKGTLSGPNEYSFYFQKQPGLDWKNFSFSINQSDDYDLASIEPQFNRIGDLYIFDEVLKKDFEIKTKLKEK